MSSARLSSLRGFFLAALVGAVTMGACSLNTQPIPPGAQAQSDGGPFDNTGGSGGLSSDASTNDSGTIATNPAPGDAGDAAVDASDEDASDADTDAADE